VVGPEEMFALQSRRRTGWVIGLSLVWHSLKPAQASNQQGQSLDEIKDQRLLEPGRCMFIYGRMQQCYIYTRIWTGLQFVQELQESYESLEPLLTAGNKRSALLRW
jgi:hypothetical protein